MNIQTDIFVFGYTKQLVGYFKKFIFIKTHRLHFSLFLGDEIVSHAWETSQRFRSMSESEWQDLSISKMYLTACTAGEICVQTLGKSKGN